MNNSISIIIPVYLEEAHLKFLIEDLAGKLHCPDMVEVIIADGSDSAGTRALVQDYQLNASLPYALHYQGCAKGRAIQMNQGAQMAKHSILHFVHADSILPINFDKEIRDQIAAGAEAGCFRLRFDSKHLLLSMSAWFTRFNFPICRGGDQSLFILKTKFEQLGGFNENYTVCEDSEFTDRIYKTSRFAVIPASIITSARRYRENGYWKLQYRYARIHAMRLNGSEPPQLLEYYRKYVK